MHFDQRISGLLSHGSLLEVENRAGHQPIKVDKGSA